MCDILFHFLNFFGSERGYEGGNLYACFILIDGKTFLSFGCSIAHSCQNGYVEKAAFSTNFTRQEKST